MWVGRGDADLLGRLGEACADGFEDGFLVGPESEEFVGAGGGRGGEGGDFERVAEGFHAFEEVWGAGGFLDIDADGAVGGEDDGGEVVAVGEVEVEV